MMIKLSPLHVWRLCTEYTDVMFFVLFAKRFKFLYYLFCDYFVARMTRLSVWKVFPVCSEAEVLSLLTTGTSIPWFTKAKWTKTDLIHVHWWVSLELAHWFVLKQLITHVFDHSGTRLMLGTIVIVVWGRQYLPPNLMIPCSLAIPSLYVSLFTAGSVNSLLTAVKSILLHLFHCL